VESIHKAADEEGGVRLLGHMYVRYFADLFGGRALGAPTRMALDLPSTPHFYIWDPKVLHFLARKSSGALAHCNNGYDYDPF
jgi:hypothetical protein